MPDSMQGDDLASLAADEAALEALSKAPAQEPAKTAVETKPVKDAGTLETPKPVEAPKGETPAETKYDQAKKKSEEREAKAWQKINDDKAALAAERAAFQKEREAAKPQPQAEKKYSSADFHRHSDIKELQYHRLMAEGKEEDANEALAEAKLARREAQQLEREEKNRPAQAPVQQQAAQIDQSKVNESWSRAKQEFPEMTDKESTLNKALVEFISQNREVIDFPDGPYLATVFVKNRLEASRVPALETENKQLKTRVAELEQATSVSGGGATGQRPGAVKKFGDMSLEEMDREMQSEYERAGR